MSRFAFTLFIGTALCIASLAGQARADKLKDITCEQFLAMDEDQQDNIVYWVDGVSTASSKKEVAADEVDVGMDAFGRPVAEVVTACQADKKASLWSKIKAHF